MGISKKGNLALGMAEIASPYGNISSLRIGGTSRADENAVVLAVTLGLDNDCNTRQLSVAGTSEEKRVSWNGVGQISYKTMLAGPCTSAEILLTYLHVAKEGILNVTPTIKFNPFGTVKLTTKVVVLGNGFEHTSFAIPDDVIEDRMRLSGSSSSSSQALHAGSLMDIDLKSLFGIKRERDTDEDEEEDESRKTRTLAKTFGSLPSMSKIFNGSRTEKKTRIAPNTNDLVFPGIEEFSNSIQARDAKKQREERMINDVLIPKWGEAVATFARIMLADPGRVRELLRKLHTHPPYSAPNPSEVFAVFIKSILESQIEFKITHSHIHFFKDSALGIARSWLTVQENIYLNQLFVDRKELFTEHNQGFSGQYSLKGFRLDRILRENICPRYIVQQFAIDCFDAALSHQRPLLIVCLKSAVGKCYCANKKDPFLSRLSLALSYTRPREHIVAMGMFVKIGWSTPEYEMVSKKTMIEEMEKEGTPSSSTPFRFVKT